MANDYNYLINSYSKHISQTFDLKKEGFQLFLLIKIDLVIVTWFNIQKKSNLKDKSKWFIILRIFPHLEKINLRRHIKEFHEVKIFFFLNSKSRGKLNWKHIFKWFKSENMFSLCLFCDSTFREYIFLVAWKALH